MTEKWMDNFVLPGSVPHIRKKTDKKTPEEKAEGSIKFGNEPGRILGPKEQKIYDDYVYFCGRAGVQHGTEERWRMESQRIPNV